MNYAEEVRIPHPDSMNSGLSYPKPDFMTNLLGKPRNHLTSDCAPVTNRGLKSKLVFGMDVGPFDVSGLKLAAESLARIFARVQAKEPELYRQIGTAGMLCCRAIRGTKHTPSNHSWGGAIDLKINGILDQRGDGHCQRGLLILYPYFHNEGWFWGAEYRGKFEDAMHWEVAKETLQRWYG